MGDDLRTAWVIVVAIVRSKLQNPWNLLINTVVNSLDVVTPTIAIAALTRTFGTLGGWEFSDVALLLGTSNLCVGLSLLLAGAFDSFLFAPIYRSGAFEAALLRPSRPVIFLAASNVRPYRIGRVIASVVVLGWALVALGEARWKILAVLPFITVVGTAMLSAFWFIDASANIRLGQANGLTRNIPFIAGEAAFFPQGLYPLPVRLFVQFALGLGSATYLPISYLLGKGPNLGFSSLLVGPIVLVGIAFVAARIWDSAIRRYEMIGRQ